MRKITIKAPKKLILALNEDTYQSFYSYCVVNNLPMETCALNLIQQHCFDYFDNLIENNKKTRYSRSSCATEIDEAIRKEIYSDCSWPEMEIFVFSHRDNFNNNSDKYLFIMRAESQPFMIWKNYNDIDYDLKSLEEKSELSFVVVWNWELSFLISAFRSFYNCKQ